MPKKIYGKKQKCFFGTNNSINQLKIDNYILIQNLGKNSFTDYYLAKLEGKDKYFFVKRIKEPMIAEKKIKNSIYYEIKILKSLNHPNIVKIEDLKKTSNHIYIIMEYINGGNLSTCLKKYMEKNKNAFSEQIIQQLMRQIINAIVYIHKNNIIHKNLSLDNIMVNFESDNDKQNLNMLKSKIKIIHFHENVDLIENDSTNNSNLKTFKYLEPNLLKIFLKSYQLYSLYYNKTMDIWSLGIIFYKLLVGKYVFEINSLKDCDKIEDGSYSVPLTISKESISFLNGMLQYDPSYRLNIEQLNTHPFLTKNIIDFQKFDLKRIQYLKSKRAIFNEDEDRI